MTPDLNSIMVERNTNNIPEDGRQFVRRVRGLEPYATALAAVAAVGIFKDARIAGAAAVVSPWLLGRAALEFFSHPRKTITPQYENVQLECESQIEGDNGTV